MKGCAGCEFFVLSFPASNEVCCDFFIPRLPAKKGNVKVCKKSATMWMIILRNCVFISRGYEFLSMLQVVILQKIPHQEAGTSFFEYHQG